MARVLTSPAPLVLDARPSVFLAGSIEMGVAEDWQAELTHALDDLDVTILNPRREAWDSTWRQSIDEPRFREQVEWELEALERSTVIALYLAPATKAPISLLELGLFARSGKVLACCPDGYWRKGNVEVVCARYGVTLVSAMSELIPLTRQRLGATS